MSPSLIKIQSQPNQKFSPYIIKIMAPYRFLMGSWLGIGALTVDNLRNLTKTNPIHAWCMLKLL